MSLTDLVLKKRAKARKQTWILLWIISASTACLFFLHDIIYPKLLFFPLIANPYLFLYCTAAYFSIPAPVICIGLLAFSAVPLIGCKLIDLGKPIGEKLVFFAELCSIVLTVLVGSYIVYSLIGLEIVYVVPGYLPMLVTGVAVPAVILFFLNRWVPKEAKKKKAKRRF